MAKPTKAKASNKKPAETTKQSTRKPRVRKVETVRERNQKAMAKVEARASKPEGKLKRFVKKTAGAIYRPLRKPLRVLTAPFRTRPVRFVGRILGKILWPTYFRNSYREVKQVTWPSRKDTWKLTLAVLIFAVVFGLAAAGTDFVLDKIIRRIVFRA